MPEYVTEQHAISQGWVKKAERIGCSAPLPEDPADPVLTRMLAPAPNQMPTEEDKAESGKIESGPHPGGVSNIVSGGTRIPSSEDKSEGGVDVSPSHGKKRAASEDWEGKAPKRGKVPPSDGSGLKGDAFAQSHDEDKPLAKL